MSAVSPLPPGLAAAIAQMQATRDRIAARRAAFPAQADRPTPAPAGPSARPSPRRGHGTPGPERLNRPVQVGRVIHVWWNWD